MVNKERSRDTGMNTSEQPAGEGPTVGKASEFKATCLQLMNRVAETGEEIVITKHGRPVSRLVPYRTKPRTLFGVDRGRIELVGDIIEPVDVEWEAHHGPPGNAVQ